MCRESLNIQLNRNNILFFDENLRINLNLKR